MTSKCDLPRPLEFEITGNIRKARKTDLGISDVSIICSYPISNIFLTRQSSFTSGRESRNEKEEKFHLFYLVGFYCWT